MRTVLLSSVISAVILILSAVSAQAQGHARGAYSFDIVVNGHPQPIYQADGQAYVAGVFGAAYEIRVHNHSGERVEAVVAVDGRDVISGEPVNPRRHRGYLVPARGTTSIDGFRSSSSSVATFRFSTIPRSYAWRTGTAWGIGTIRAWVFEESRPEPIVVVPHGHPHAPHARGEASTRQRSSVDGASAAPRDMGTEYGEQRWSPVMRTRFQRRSHAASAILGLRYQSHEALAAAGILHPVPTWGHVVLYDDGPPLHWRDPVRYAPPPPGHPYN